MRLGRVVARRGGDGGLGGHGVVELVADLDDLQHLGELRLHDREALRVRLQNLGLVGLVAANKNI